MRRLLFILVLLLGCAYRSYGQLTIDGINTNFSFSGTSSSTTVDDRSSTAHDALVFMIISNAGQTITGVTDQDSNTYVNAVSSLVNAANSNIILSIWVTCNFALTTSSGTYTINFAQSGGSGTTGTGYYAFVKGQSHTACNGGGAKANTASVASGATWSSGNFPTTTVTNSMILGFGTVANGPYTPQLPSGGGFSTIPSSLGGVTCAHQTDCGESKAENSAGTYSTSFFNNGGGFAMANTSSEGMLVLGNPSVTGFPMVTKNMDFIGPFSYDSPGGTGMRDKSYPSEAAARRILGATRLHCDDYTSGDDDRTHLTERGSRWGSDHEASAERGDPDESPCERFNRHLRGGHAAERI